MRSLCLLLILSNVFYLIWSQFIDIDFAGYSEISTNLRAGKILLAAEAPGEQPVSASTDATPNAVEASTRGECVSVGPFGSLSEATGAAATLSAAGFTSKQRVEEGELWAGYWVYVADLGGAAETAISQLRDRGVEDVFLLPGESAPVLSLGVFVDVDRARRRAQIAQELGLKVRLQDRKRSGSVYWIDATPVSPGQALDPAIFPPEPGKIVRIELQPCPRAGSE